MMHVNSDQVVAEARRWIGVPWLHQGRSRRGVDCIGLLLVVCWRLGLTDYDITGYGIAPEAPFMLAECDRMMVRTDEPRAGDVLLFRLARNLLHVMLCVNERRVIHAWAAHGRVAEVGLAPAWRPRIAAAYRVPGVH